MSLRTEKSQSLASQFGFETALEMLDEAGFDSVVPGICMNKGCNYTTEVEPDSRDGYCECCGTNTVRSLVELCVF